MRRPRPQCVGVYLCVGLENAIKAMHKIRQQKKHAHTHSQKANERRKLGETAAG